MLPPRNRLPHFPKLSAKQPITTVENGKPSPVQQSHTTILERAIYLLQPHADRNIPEIDQCLCLLARIQKGECSEQLSSVYRTSQNTSRRIQSLELSIKNKDMTIASLKSQLRKLTHEYNAQLRSLLKKKVVIDSRYTNFEDIIRGIRQETARQPDYSPEPACLCKGDLKDINSEAGGVKTKQNLNQPWERSRGIRSVKLPGMADDRNRQNRNSSDWTGLEERLITLTQRLSDVELQIESTKDELMESKRLNKLLQEELAEGALSEAYLTKELERKLSETEQELTTALNSIRVPSRIQLGTNNDACQSTMVKQKQLLEDEYIAKQEELVRMEQCYMSRITELEQQLARS